MTPTDRHIAVASHAQRLATVLQALALLGLVSGAFPLALTSPVWALRLGDGVVGIAPLVLLAVILRFTSLQLNPDTTAAYSSQRRTPQRRTAELARRWAILYGLVVPLQLLCFVWLWIDSQDQINAQLTRASSQLADLSARINATGSRPELQRLLASTTPGLLPPLPQGSLPQQKTQLVKALDLSRSRLQANISSQRTSVLVNAIPGTLRVIIGAAIVCAFLLTIHRQLL